MCEVYEVVVTEPVAYFARFVRAKYALSLDSVKTYVSDAARVDKKVKEMLDDAVRKMGGHYGDAGPSAYYKAYVYTFCRLRKLKSALIIIDWMDEEPYRNHVNIVAFDLPEPREVASEIKDYERTIEHAMERARGADRELLERCHYLDVGTDVKRCLAKAREVLEEAKADARPRA